MIVSGRMLLPLSIREGVALLEDECRQKVNLGFLSIYIFYCSLVHRLESANWISYRSDCSVLDLQEVACGGYKSGK